MGGYFQGSVAPRPLDPRIYSACMQRWRRLSTHAELKGSVSPLALWVGAA